MMQTYVGTKLVKGLAMSRLAYVQYRGWALPADENGADAGYLVEYMDGGEPNHPGHDGYISWCPAAQFEGANVALGNLDHLAPHEQRVVAERAQLADRLTKLRAFLETPLFAGLPSHIRCLRITQVSAMATYLETLDQIMVDFGSAAAPSAPATTEGPRRGAVMVEPRDEAEILSILRAHGATIISHRINVMLATIELIIDHPSLEPAQLGQPTPSYTVSLENGNVVFRQVVA